ncbi:hypothetical protein LAZ40_01565 [Cereibacter sphaeroides]|uniref:hypothetical protein n=1 Tax=Cereibacter sphaeroides TaxID=1063 RepID=UPI001F211229|nr:hypothetical protein [Cereibacter sphaeroides]MCE6957748.1 hypothetical protein [Cereibacter sphaeroides]MCE6971626.1 hypothetical protein [Cereibacter sphaeroides]
MDDRNRIEGPRDRGVLARVVRDPVAVAAIALVAIQLFTRITYDVVMSFALVGLVVLLATRTKD